MNPKNLVKISNIIGRMFNTENGNYELYYPYFKDNKKVVLCFSDYQRYGKFGS